MLVLLLIGLGIFILVMFLYFICSLIFNKNDFRKDQFMGNEITFLVVHGDKRQIKCFKRYSLKCLIFRIIGFFKGYKIEKIDCQFILNIF